jgi:hypothetical protein
MIFAEERKGREALQGAFFLCGRCNLIVKKRTYDEG